MCGSEGRMFKAEIEGSILTVCGNCAKYGKILSEIRQEAVKHKKEKKVIEEGPEKEVIFLVAADFADKVRKKRESLGMKQEDFAKMVNEKVSLIHNIETGKITPSIKLARKLEKMLKMKLVEQHEETHEQVPAASTEEFTIGDFIKVNKK